MSGRGLLWNTFSRIRQLARASLLGAVVASTCVACLDDPANYTAAERIPPTIDVTRAEPSLMQVNAYADSFSTITFSVPFRSDDRGDPLLFRFLLDLEPDDSDDDLRHLEANRLPPDPRPFFEQTDRSLVWSWVPGEMSGCHSVTLILTYAVQEFLPVDESESTRATWWIVLGNASDAEELTCGVAR